MVVVLVGACLAVAVVVLGGGDDITIAIQIERSGAMTTDHIGDIVPAVPAG